jgi:RNA polymerase sigma-70 factor (ECF subfamily)
VLSSNETDGSRTEVRGPETLPANKADLVPHLNAAYNLARWLLPNEADAEDVVQEAYLRAIRSFHTLRGSDGRPWLLGIVRNLCYDWHRQTCRMPRQDISPEQLDGIRSVNPSPEAMLLEKGDRAELQEALDSLPPHLREVLILREFEELSYKQIAAVSGVREGTVMSRLSRARQRLGAGRPPQARTCADIA